MSENGNDPKLAFCADGLERMNENILHLNGGVPHKPIYKIRVYEHASKFSIGSAGNKKDKYVEAAKGTNLYFAIYCNNEGVRSFETIPLNEVIDRMKKGLSPVPEMNAAGNRLLFYLSPNDLVYVPMNEEIEKNEVCYEKSNGRIYKMVSSQSGKCFFINSSVASPIVNKIEFSSANKMERAMTGEMIKEVCIPLKVDRLGNITYVGTEFLPKRK